MTIRDRLSIMHLQWPVESVPGVLVGFLIFLRHRGYIKVASLCHIDTELTKLNQ